MSEATVVEFYPLQLEGQRNMSLIQGSLFQGDLCQQVARF
jgi:hypothetical protein